MTTRRVLFVDHAAALGGAELSLLDIAQAMRDNATVVLFEHGPFEARLRERGISVEVIDHGAGLRSVKKQSRMPSPRAALTATRLVFKLAKLARQHDLLYANSPKAFLVSAMAGALARRPVAWHLRDIIDGIHFSDSNIRLMVRTANARAVRVIANSQATADTFIAQGGRADRVTVIHNGIDPAPFDAHVRTRHGVRAELSISDDAFLVGSFSRLSPWKGQHILLDALEALPGVHALIVGGALFGETAYELELSTRAKRPPLTGRIHMLGARNDIAELMHACDVIAHTSTSPEPFGRVIVEALLAERPLIASDAGGVREIVQDGSTAILTEPGNAIALREAIDELRRSPERAMQLARAGSAHVRANFLVDVMVARVRREIDVVLTEQNA